MNYISDAVQSQVAALEARENAFGKRVRRLAPAGVGLACSTVAAGVLVQFLGPDLQPSKVDVPKKLLECFSTSALASGGSHSFAGVAETLMSQLSNLQPYLAGLALLGLLVGVFNAAKTGEMTRAIMPMIAGFTIVGSLGMVRTIFDGTSDGFQNNPREDFVHAVENHKIEIVAGDLRQVDQQSTPVGLYVLAQLSITGDEPNAKGRIAVTSDIASRLTLPAAGFVPRPDVLFAIEHAAFGRAKSPAALAYEDEQLAKQRIAKIALVILESLTLAVGASALGFFSLGQIIGRRLRRIRDMLKATVAR